MSDARQTILASIREHLEHARRRVESPAPIDRAARSPGTPLGLEDAEACRTRFAEVLSGVGGQVHRAHDVQDAAHYLAATLHNHGARSFACSDHEDVQGVAALLPEPLRAHPHDSPREELLEVPLGLTAAQWGIAETGTVILESDRERHRLVSLLPPVHVVLLREAAILPTLGAALGELQHDDVNAMSRALTFITGPSRTADIELTLVVGVHGPSELHVILLPSAPSAG